MFDSSDYIYYSILFLEFLFVSILLRRKGRGWLFTLLGCLVLMYVTRKIGDFLLGNYLFEFIPSLTSPYILRAAVYTLTDVVILFLLQMLVPNRPTSRGFVSAGANTGQPDHPLREYPLLKATLDLPLYRGLMAPDAWGNRPAANIVERFLEQQFPDGIDNSRLTGDDEYFRANSPSMGTLLIVVPGLVWIYKRLPEESVWREPGMGGVTAFAELYFFPMAGENAGIYGIHLNEQEPPASRVVRMSWGEDTSYAALVSHAGEAHLKKLIGEMAAVQDWSDPEYSDVGLTSSTRKRDLLALAQVTGVFSAHPKAFIEPDSGSPASKQDDIPIVQETGTFSMGDVDLGPRGIGVQHGGMHISGDGVVTTKLTDGVAIDSKGGVTSSIGDFNIKTDGEVSTKLFGVDIKLTGDKKKK